VGSSYAGSADFSVPSALQGNYYITVFADRDNLVPECTAEQNNTSSAGPVNIVNSLPDLTVPSVTPLPTAVLGSTQNVSWTAQNVGQPMGQSTTWIDRVYLSTNDTWDDFDTPVGGAIKTAQSASGESYAANAQITIPNRTPGNYYLIVYSDAGGNVPEGLPESTAENNNWKATPITLTVPGVDLQASNVGAGSPLFSGVAQNISWTITNTGDTATLSSE
jgi:hypothetical protein